MGQDDFFHIVSHEEVINSPALVPLYKCFMGPETKKKENKNINELNNNSDENKCHIVCLNRD